MLSKENALLEQASITCQLCNSIWELGPYATSYVNRIYAKGWLL